MGCVVPVRVDCGSTETLTGQEDHKITQRTAAACHSVWSSNLVLVSEPASHEEPNGKPSPRAVLTLKGICSTLGSGSKASAQAATANPKQAVRQLSHRIHRIKHTQNKRGKEREREILRVFEAVCLRASGRRPFPVQQSPLRWERHTSTGTTHGCTTDPTSATAVCSMKQPPDPAKLAGDLSQRISNHGAALGGPGKPPLKLLKWALGQLEECARTHSNPPSNVVDVAMEAIKEEIVARPPKPPHAAAAATVAASSPAVPGGGGGGGHGKGNSSGEKKTAAGAAGRGGGGGSGGRLKGKVVFTPLYGCEEAGAGVGPVSSILEVN